MQTMERRALPADLLRKIASAAPSNPRLANIRDGQYLYEIRNLLSEEKRAGHCFIIELGVVEATASADPSRPGITPNPEQSLCGVVINLTKSDSAPGNVKRFILGLLGIDEQEMLTQMRADQVQDEIMETYADMVSPAQPCKGMLVRGDTYHKIIKTGPNQGKPFVGVNWLHVPDQTKSMIAARRKLIEQGVIGSPATAF